MRVKALRRKRSEAGGEEGREAEGEDKREQEVRRRNIGYHVEVVEQAVAVQAPQVGRLSNYLSV